MQPRIFKKISFCTRNHIGTNDVISTCGYVGNLQIASEIYRGKFLFQTVTSSNSATPSIGGICTLCILLEITIIHLRMIIFIITYHRFSLLLRNLSEKFVQTHFGKTKCAPRVVCSAPARTSNNFLHWKNSKICLDRRLVRHRHRLLRHTAKKNIKNCLEKLYYTCN